MPVCIHLHLIIKLSSTKELLPTMSQVYGMEPKSPNEWDLELYNRYAFVFQILLQLAVSEACFLYDLTIGLVEIHCCYSRIFANKDSFLLSCNWF